MKTKTANKTIIKHKKMSGKVIGISEENAKSKIKLLLDNCNMEINAGKDEYSLGEKIEMDINIEVNKINKTN